MFGQLTAGASCEAAIKHSPDGPLGVPLTLPTLAQKKKIEGKKKCVLIEHAHSHYQQVRSENMSYAKGF